MPVKNNFFNQYTYLRRVQSCVKYKPSIYHRSGQGEHVERPVDQVIPTPGNVETTQFFIAPRFIFD